MAAVTPGASCYQNLPRVMATDPKATKDSTLCRSCVGKLPSSLDRSISHCCLWTGASTNQNPASSIERERAAGERTCSCASTGSALRPTRGGYLVVRRSSH
jgi:hypothetical protein